MEENLCDLKLYTSEQISSIDNSCDTYENVKSPSNFYITENTVNSTFSLTLFINKDEASQNNGETHNYFCDFSLLEKYLTDSREENKTNVHLYNAMSKKCSQNNNNNDIVITNDLKKRFKCEFCQRAFKKKCNLIAHERTHTGERPFQCTMCDKTFSESSSVFKHQRVHTGERPYKCDICDRVFKQICNLKRHRNEHYRRVFKCEKCNKCFVRNNHLMQHKLTHSYEENLTDKINNTV